MAFFDLSVLTDSDLDQLRVDVLTEQETRQSMAQIPTQVADLSKTYREGGGDPEVLIKAVTHVLDPEPEPEPE